MSRNMAQGFSVSQPSFNTPLLFCPAMGTQELDDLINAYVPGSASLQEKRAFVSMDFFNYTHATGESFRYYSVPSMTASAESSPAQDSGYSSSFVSPALSNWSWPQAASTSSSTPATASKRSPVSRASPPDFSNIPGMKIMTKDGRDVTNSASRGCKTKEQRDHAHLMRIIKACDACKKKKIRCDPSHKKRTSGATPAAQAPAQSTARSRAVAKKTKQASPPPTAPSPPQQSSSSAEDASFYLDPSMVDLDLDLLEMDAMAQDSWNSFVDFDESLATLPESYDFFFDPAGHFSPASSMPAVQDASFSHVQEYASSSAAAAPALPYMAAGAPGTDYVDFNLFSPTSSFIDDESMPVNDIGMVSASDSYGTVREPAVSPTPLLQVQQHAVPGPRVVRGGQNVRDQQVVQQRDWLESNAPGGVDANSGVSSPLIGGVQNSGGMAVAPCHGQVHYAPSYGQQQSVHLATPAAPDRASGSLAQSTSSRGGSDEQHVDAASRSAPLSSEAGVERSRLRGASRGSSAVNAAITERGVGGDVAVNQSTVAVLAVSSTAAVATQPASVAVYATRGTSAGVDSNGLIVTESQHVAPSSTSTQISRGSGRLSGVPGTQEVEVLHGFIKASSSSVQQKPTHSVSALVALGVLASGLPSSLALCLVQYALGLLVVGAVFFPKALAELASPEQRICGTTPLPSSSDQDEKHGPPNITAWQYTCPGGLGRASVQHQQACRQTDHARPLSAVGRLQAAFGLSRALTQWNI